MPSAAAQVIVSVIPIVGIVMGSLVLFFFLYWNHRQKILLIEKGMYVKPIFDLDAFSLFAGLILTCIGGVLVAFFLILEGFTYPVLGGLIPLSLGVGFLVFYIIRAHSGRTSDET